MAAFLRKIKDFSELEVRNVRIHMFVGLLDVVTRKNRVNLQYSASLGILLPEQNCKYDITNTSYIYSNRSYIGCKYNTSYIKQTWYL